MKKLLVLSAASMFLLTSCGVAGLVSTPSEYVDAGKEVSVTKKNTNIFGFTPMKTQEVTNAALKELKGKCNSGITNIRTTVSSKAFVVGFEKLEMTANCK